MRFLRKLKPLIIKYKIGCFHALEEDVLSNSPLSATTPSSCSDTAVPCSDKEDMQLRPRIRGRRPLGYPWSSYLTVCTEHQALIATKAPPLIGQATFGAYSPSGRRALMLSRKHIEEWYMETSAEGRLNEHSDKKVGPQGAGDTRDFSECKCTKGNTKWLRILAYTSSWLLQDRCCNC